MGVNPPLPAPTDLSSTDHDTTLRDDLATDVSARTDKTSYSIPEDGTPITINTAKKRSLHKKHPSQTSLLIEYFDGGKADEKARSRPSVRVRVTPSSRKNKSSNDHIKITQTSRSAHKPSYTRRISLGNKSPDGGITATEASYSEESNVSSLPPVEIEVLPNESEMSSVAGRYMPAASDISSMPPDSMLDGPPATASLSRRRSRSLERDENSEIIEKDTLKAPTRQRSRSLSKDRITQRVMEKLQQKPADAGVAKIKVTKASREDLTSTRKSHKRTSKGSREEELSGVSGTDSSLLSSNAHRRSGDVQSLRSGVSGTSSINNPKLLATVEDAIKRLILPELNALKEEQRTQKNRNKFDDTRDSTHETVESTGSRDSAKRRVSKSSSAPHMHGTKPKVVLNRDGDDPGTILSGNSSRKDRRSSRGSVSERSYAESVSREDEKARHKKSKSKEGHSSRDAALAGIGAAGLTAAALRHHDSRESKSDRKERRRRHSRSSRSRTASISGSAADEYDSELLGPVPPLPVLQSELIGSEMTRDSILSARTETRERPSSRSSRDTESEMSLREVPRGGGILSPPPRTPARTSPAALQRSLGTAHSNRSLGDIGRQTPQSDRSYSSQRDVASPALAAAAAAKARALESTGPQVSQYEIADQTPTRGMSPIQSEASYREEVRATASPRHLRSAHSTNSVSSAVHKIQEKESRLSIQSFESSPSTKAAKQARTKKRPQGVNLETKRDVLSGSPDVSRDVDAFFEKAHQENETYRRELESSQENSPYLDDRQTDLSNGSANVQYLDSPTDKVALTQNVRKVGSNPEYVHTPMAVESAVASLHEPSSLSVHSSTSSPIKKSRLSQVSPAYEEHSDSENVTSKQRWGAIRDQAQTLAAHPKVTNSPRQSLARSIDEPPQMHANALPGNDDMMPAIGYGMDDESEVDTNPSIIQGPLGGADYHSRSDDLLSRQEERERERTPSQQSYRKVAALGAGAGAAAIAAAAVSRMRDDRTPSTQPGRHHASVEDEYDQDYAGEHQYAPQPSYAHGDRTPTRSPALWKDEGYQSANQPGGITPDLLNRSKYLDDDGLGEYDDGGYDGDVFVGGPRHTRHESGNSHGMSSPLYDAATGKGMNNIQSKDVVALMDHLTVRDAQRNARDTEILVTLVRSAAEMRNSFEEMKQFIKTQDAMIMKQNDQRADLTEQRILGGPRPQPIGSPRAPRGASTEDVNSVEQRRKNVFKRALKGLSLKGDSDIKKIEAMLIQLLGEVEGLKEVHQLTLAQQNRSNSLNSYEVSRASGDPGYEPEGRAGTSSSPNQSGYLSNPSSRRIQDMHSGYDVHQPHRVSTVAEEDDEYAEDELRYENTERMTTPTQEARRNNPISPDSPPQPTRAFRDSQSQENTPKRKHKSNSSSIFGIPKISRWSKTTASTNPESLPRNSGSRENQPYSPGSRSGSQINMAYYPEEPYQVQQDDRLRSSTSLARDVDRQSIRSARSSVRSASPLIPDDTDQPVYVLDDPKYQAHRNSLNLQHPQPRAGPTGRHQNHLENQAQIFDPNPVRSPDFDQWGSNPALARNRLSGGYPGNLSPISSEGGYSQHSAAEQAAPPPRPPKIHEDPLIPQPLAGYGQARQMYSAQNDYGSNSQGALMTPLAPIQEVRYSLETDTGHRYSPTPSPRPSAHNLKPATAMASPQRKITGPRPMGSRSPSGMSGQGQLEHSSTVIRRKPVVDRADTESLESYRSSDTETF